MDDRLEIWIAKDPDTNEESQAVSLRKLRKGVRIGRLKTSTLVKRLDASDWVTLERLLADAEVALSKTPPPVGVQGHAPIAPPRPAPRSEALPSIVVSPSAIPPPMVRPKADSTGEITEVEEIVAEPPAAIEAPPTPSVKPPPADEDTALTTQWFTESVLPPEPDDDTPIFPTRSLLDLGFEQVMTTRFVRLTWVLLLASLALGVLAALIRAIAAIAGGDSTQAVTAVATLPVVVLAAFVVAAIGRMLLEVLLAVFRIADRLTALSKSVAR
jgi:hypothetical protein